MSFTEPIELPVAHGEGKFLTADPALLDRLEQDGQIVLAYTDLAGRPTRSIPPIPTARPAGRGTLRPDRPHLRPDASSRTIHRLLAPPALDPTRVELMSGRRRTADFSEGAVDIVARLEKYRPMIDKPFTDRLLAPFEIVLGRTPAERDLPRRRTRRALTKRSSGNRLVTFGRFVMSNYLDALGQCRR